MQINNVSNAGAVSSSEAVDQLNSFLRGEISAVETYKQALEAVKTDAIRQQLLPCHDSHQRSVELLRRRITDLHGEPAEGSGVWGAFAKAVEGGAALLGEKIAVSTLEEGEDHGLKDYKADLSKLDVESRRLVEMELLAAQLKTHRTLRDLKHSLSTLFYKSH